MIPSTTIRRIHRYLGLFFLPWMLMYGFSGLLMNHRPLIQKIYNGPFVSWEKERDLPYDASFPADADAKVMAIQILSDLNLDGAHNVSNPDRNGQFTINRNDPVTPRRIVYNPTDKLLRIERQVSDKPFIFWRLHHRTRYVQPYFADDAWAFSVDIAIFAILFWGISGLMMWWKMRSQRRSGMITAICGLGLFIFLIIFL